MKRSVKQMGAFVTSLLMASCSQDPTSPSATSSVAAQSPENGVVQGSAAGDVNVGPNPIDMNLVRVAQTDGVAAFYANPSGEYIVGTGRDTEIYIQIWNSNPVVVNPRLIIDWGNGQTDFTGCGSCRLSTRYNAQGKYTVKVTMDDRVSSRTTRTFTLNARNAEQPGGTFTFSNSTRIEIPANSSSVSSGPADPYPSAINLSGISGAITNASVTIKSFNSTHCHEVRVMLVAPDGRTVKLLDNDSGGADVTNATLVFVDGAPALDPTTDFGPGTFTIKPTSDKDTMFPGPAPNIADGLTLSTLTGANPNGTWKLFVYDDEGGDISEFAGGWSLTVTTGVSSSSTGVVVSQSAPVSLTAGNLDRIRNYSFQKGKGDR